MLLFSDAYDWEARSDSEGVGSKVFRYRCSGTRKAVVRAEKCSLRAIEASSSTSSNNVSTDCKLGTECLLARSSPFNASSAFFKTARSLDINLLCVFDFQPGAGPADSPSTGVQGVLGVCGVRGVGVRGTFLTTGSDDDYRVRRLSYLDGLPKLTTWGQCLHTRSIRGLVTPIMRPGCGGRGFTSAP